jgi:hypothetical protein
MDSIPQIRNIRVLLKNAFIHLENFKKTYTYSAIAHKKKLISSIFPEKIEFDGKNVELQESMMF